MVEPDYLEGKGVNYKEYRLTKNPFPNVPVTEPNPAILVDRDKEVDYIFKATLNSYKTGESDVITILGVHGSGKSHLLRYFENKITEQLFGLEKNRGVPIYTTAGENFFQFYRNIVTSFKLSFFEKLVNELILKISEKDTKLLEKIRNDTLLEEDINRIIPLILKKVKIEMPDFLKCFLYVKLDDKRITAWRYLVGDTLNPAERGLLGVSRSMKETDILRTFSTFKEILHFLDFKTIFIFLDELENITAIKNDRERLRYYDRLRHFIDLNTKGLCLVIAIHDKSYKQIKDQSEPLFRRLLNVRELEPFKKNSTFEIIKAYLEYHRKSEYLNYQEILNEIKKKFHTQTPEIYPFSNAFVEGVMKKSKGLVSEILRYARNAIDFGIENNKNILENIDEIPIPTILGSESEEEEIERKLGI